MPTPLFNFIPLKKKKNIPVEAYVKITKAGSLMIPMVTVMELTGDSKPFLLQLYHDQDKRTLGFRAIKSYNNPDKNSSVRFIKINRSKAGYTFGMTSVRNFTKLFSNILLPTPRLKLEKYKTTYLPGEIYYVTMPRKQTEKDITS